MAGDKISRLRSVATDFLSQMTRRNSEEWRPYFDDDEAKLLIGKHLLVGLTHRNHEDEVTGYEQIHGVVVRASQEEGIVIRLNGTTEERTLPPDLSRLEVAAPGTYRLKTTGEVVVDPDFLATWTVYPPRRH